MTKRRKKRRRTKNNYEMIEIKIWSNCNQIIETRFGTISYLEYLIEFRHELVTHGRHVILEVTKNKCRLLVDNIVGECLL
jgi:hypothetical protein